MAVQEFNNITTRPKEYEYLAFISYKRSDEKWARWLQNKLERYKVPVALRNSDPSLPENLRPVFRDKTDLSGGRLTEGISSALDKAKFLIVLCSPEAAKSEWVSKEISHFIDSGRINNIIPFIISGQPFAEDPNIECFPPQLRSLRGDSEILGISISESGKNASFVKLVSRLLSVGFDSLWERYRRNIKRSKILGLVIALAWLAIMGVWALSIYRNRLYGEMLNNTHHAVQAWKAYYEKDYVGVVSHALEGLPAKIYGRQGVSEDILRLMYQANDMYHGLEPILVIPEDVDVGISLDKNRYYTFSDGDIALYDLSTHDEIGHTDGEKCVFVTDGLYLVTYKTDSLVVYSSKDMTRVFSVSRDKIKTIHGKSPFENTWVTSTDSSTIFISAESMEVVRELDGIPQASNNGLCRGIDEVSRMYSNKGSFFVTATEKAYRVYDMRTGQVVYQYNGYIHWNAKDNYSFSSAENVFVYKKEDKIISVDLSTKKENVLLNELSANAYCYNGDLLAVVTNGNSLASNYRYFKTVVVIDIGKGLVQQKLEQENAVMFVGFLNDNHRILTFSRHATSDGEGVLTIWNTETGAKEQITTLRTRYGLPTSGKYSRDGSFLCLSYLESITACVSLREQHMVAYRPHGSNYRPLKDYSIDETIGIKNGDYFVFYSMRNSSVLGEGIAVTENKKHIKSTNTEQGINTAQYKYGRFTDQRDSAIVSGFYDDIDWVNKIGLRSGTIYHIETAGEIVSRYRNLYKDIERYKRRQ